jgi:VanZ family protein
VNVVATWALPISWMAVILWFSSGQWSAEQTSALMPIAARLLPWATAGDLELLHSLGRKLGHLLEYAVLAVLWHRAVRRGTALGAWPARGIAVGASALWAVVDELHQWTLPDRTGSVADVMLDVTGALAGLLVLAAGWRRIADGTTTVLLWAAAIGGVGVLAVDQLTGAESRAAWLTTPLAIAALVLRRAWRGSRSLRRGAGVE